MKRTATLFMILTGLFALGLAAQPSRVMGGGDGRPGSEQPVNADAASGNNSHLLLDDEGRIYPNPSEGPINLVLPMDGPAVENLQVFSTLGQQVYPPMVRHHSRAWTVDLTGFTPGIYFIRYSLNGKTVVQRTVLK